MARLLSAIARWKLEHGTRFVTIDQLATCSTIFNTIRTVWRLEALTLLSIGLLLVWGLSPIGSQATQRVVSLKMRMESSVEPFSWLDTSSLYTWISNDQSAVLSSIAAVQSSAMMAPQTIQESSVYQWANVKVPMLEKLRSNGTSAWTTTSNGSSTLYSSLAGVPIVNKFDLRSSSFVLNASYWYASCSSITELMGATVSPVGLTNYTRSTYSRFAGSSLLWQIAVNQSDLTGTGDQPLPLVLEVIGQNATDGFMRAHLTCSLTTSIVEVDCSCDTSSNCRATSIRYAPNHTPDTFSIPLVAPTARLLTISKFLANFGNSFPIAHAGTAASSVFEQYLQDPTTNPFARVASYATLSNIPVEDYGIRSPSY
jgi:hypothetical protein